MLYVWTRRYQKEKISKVVPILEENWKEYAQNMFLRGYYITKLPHKPPADRTLRRWRQTGKAKSIAGNWIDSNQYADADGNVSWLHVCKKIT